MAYLGTPSATAAVIEKYQFNFQKRYGAISNATCITGVKCSDILCCCEGKKESAGVDPQTGLPLTWRYADDYIANINESVGT